MFTCLCFCLLLGGSLADTTIQILEADGRFITLTNLLKQTKLDSVLNGGNFTVFAPTDDAFKKIPLDDLSAITADDVMLQAVLKYHVLVGFVKKLFISNEHIVQTVNGATARFNDYQHNNKFTIQGCGIIEFNKVASNGIVHVLDTVMTPPTGNIVDYLKSNKNLTKLVELATQAGILDELTRDSRTLFAPTNEAFANQFQDALNAIASDPVLLKNVLTYHVVGSTQYLKGLWNRERITTLFQGAQLVVHSKQDGENLRIKNGKVIVGDVGTTNGVVHVVDHVLLSPTNAGTVG